MVKRVMMAGSYSMSVCHEAAYHATCVVFASHYQHGALLFVSRDSLYRMLCNPCHLCCVCHLLCALYSCSFSETIFFSVFFCDLKRLILLNYRSNNDALVNLHKCIVDAVFSQTANQKWNLFVVYFGNGFCQIKTSSNLCLYHF